MAEFRVIEAGAFADYEFEAEADTREELYAICAVAAFDAMTNVANIKPEKTIEFEVAANNDEDLLYAFLAELIYIKDIEHTLFGKFEINLIEEFRLKCRASGELIDPRKQELKTDVKAVTYHKLKFGKSDRGYSAHVILDL
jgi:SHS2 domain-containing protein